MQLFNSQDIIWWTVNDDHLWIIVMFLSHSDGTHSPQTKQKVESDIIYIYDIKVETTYNLGPLYYTCHCKD